MGEELARSKGREEEIKAAKKDLENFKMKASELDKSKQLLASEKRDGEMALRNSLAEQEKKSKLMQEKLDYAEKNKNELSREIMKKEEQVKFEVDARDKDKTFYEKMKEKLEK